MRVPLTKFQAFRELAKGEQTASALEQQLSSMEKKLDELLARAEQDQKDVEKLAQAETSGDGKNSDKDKTGN